MRNAMAIALDGTRQNEVPIGALIVRGNSIIAGANNRTVRDQDATAHAEMIAIRDASEWLDRWRLDDCTLYVTLEPCAMCAGASDIRGSITLPRFKVALLAKSARECYRSFSSLAG